MDFLVQNGWDQLRSFPFRTTIQPRTRSYLSRSGSPNTTLLRSRSVWIMFRTPLLDRCPDCRTPSSVTILRLLVNLQSRVPPVLVTEELQAMGIDVVHSQSILRGHRPHPRIRRDIRPTRVSLLQVCSCIPPSSGGCDTNGNRRYVTSPFPQTIMNSCGLARH